jgi:hypothetical protein
MVVGQKITLGRIHGGRIVTVHVDQDTVTIDLGGDDIRTFRRTTTQAVRSIKAHLPRKARLPCFLARAFIPDWFLTGASTLKSAPELGR